MIKKGLPKYKFHDPRGGDVVIYYFFTSLHQDTDQTYWGGSNDDQGRVYHICKFHNSRGIDLYATA